VAARNAAPAAAFPIGHAMFSTEDTIVAIATPPGRGGVGVVRLSGPDAHRVAKQLTRHEQDFAPRHATLAHIFAPMRPSVGSPAGARDETVDEVIVTCFAAPHSYTGEDVAEISGHGSPVLLERIVSLALAEGARLAEPGEFTLRAYLGGRLDLIQAESVADLVDAVTPAQARAAMDQLDGTLTTTIRRVDAKLLDLVARSEASLDFPDEGFHFIEKTEAARALEDITRELDALLATAARGRLLREGRTVVLSGRPNTGKSSLFNALLGRDRAIVTSMPGTTRDLLSERIDVHGVPLTLVDTAGIRSAADPIEREGVERADSARANAEVVVIVLDGSAPLTDDDHRVLANESRGGARVIAINKSDAPAVWNDTSMFSDPVIRTSAMTGAGLDDLRRALVHEAVEHTELSEMPTITNIRHVQLLEAARDAAGRAGGLLASGATEELLLVELHDARRSLEEVVGRRTPDDLLRHIFSRFCIGK
jgi:tRNA modification GTPase